MRKPKTRALSRRKKQQYQRNAEIIKFYRRNPVIACEDLLGIKLIDSQKWILQSVWNCPNNILTCSRNFGKSFMIAIICMLKMLLYPNLKIYILSSKGSQAQETFRKMEEIAKKEISSIPSLKDIFINEVYAPNNSDGFSHDKASHNVTVLSGSKTFTLNSIPNNVRGKRANLLIFDESAFCDEELISVTLPFIAQDSDFKASTEQNFNAKAIKKSIPNQVIFASSSNGKSGTHYKNYVEYSKKMIAGDNNYFACDIPCDIPLKPMIDGEFVAPLLKQSVIDDEMAKNPDKALREYYNKFEADGGASQIIKGAMITRNESFILPIMSAKDKEHYAVAFDPAHKNDNSIITVMRIQKDKKIGYYGEIVSCINLIDVNKTGKKANLKSTVQVEFLRNLLVNYSGGDKMYYNGIGQVLLDAGAGGHGTSYADKLLEDWTDDSGVVRAGIIDAENDYYVDEVEKFPRAKNILKLINAKSLKNIMIEELIELMTNDLIKFPREYDFKRTVVIEHDVNTGKYRKDEKGNTILDEKGKPIEIVDSELEYRALSDEEIISLTNIEKLKLEAKSMRRVGNGFEIAKEKQSYVGDDRFDTLVLLGHYLYTLRRSEQFKTDKPKIDFREYFFSN